MPVTLRGLDKDVATMIRRITDAGLIVDQWPGSGHFRVVTSDGRVLGTIPKTPSDHRWVKNMEASLARAGVRLSPRPARRRRRARSDSGVMRQPVGEETVYHTPYVAPDSDADPAPAAGVRERVREALPGIVSQLAERSGCTEAQVRQALAGMGEAIIREQTASGTWYRLRKATDAHDKGLPYRGYVRDSVVDALPGTVAQIAGNTGLGPDQVRRALHWLRTNGLVWTSREPGVRTVTYHWVLEPHDEG